MFSKKTVFVNYTKKLSGNTVFVKGLKYFLMNHLTFRCYWIQKSTKYSLIYSKRYVLDQNGPFFSMKHAKIEIFESVYCTVPEKSTFWSKNN